MKEGFEEAGDGVSMLVSGKGRSSLIEHRAVGEHVYPRRRRKPSWGSLAT